MVKDDILRLLMMSKTGFVSGEELAKKLNFSRTAVWKHIKTLKQKGYSIEAIPSKGYRLTSVPDVILLDDVRQGLTTGVIGRKLHLLPETVSTNTLAASMAREGAAEGTVFIAERQTGGKGRLGRTWTSPPGNLYLSVVLRPDIPPYKAPLITLMGAVAVASAIRKQLKLRAGIKWPNDIYYSGKKLGGILTEMSAEPDRVHHVILGIGIDVNMDLKELPADIRRMSTTLAAETGKKIDRTSFLRQVLAELDRWYQRFLEGESSVLSEWRELDITLGSRVSVSFGPGTVMEGIAEDLDREGRLVLRLKDGTLRTVAAGDVTIQKPV